MFVIGPPPTFLPTLFRPPTLASNLYTALQTHKEVHLKCKSLETLALSPHPRISQYQMAHRLFRTLPNTSPISAMFETTCNNILPSSLCLTSPLVILTRESQETPSLQHQEGPQCCRFSIMPSYTQADEPWGHLPEVIDTSTTFQALP